MTKFKTFIYLCYNKLKDKAGKVLSNIKLTHDKLQQPDSNGNVPYVVFYQWFVEVMSYGILLFIVYLNLFIIHGWLKWFILPFSFGAIRWLWMDIVSSTSDAIRGKR